MPELYLENKLYIATTTYVLQQPPVKNLKITVSLLLRLYYHQPSFF